MCESANPMDDNEQNGSNEDQEMLSEEEAEDDAFDDLTAEELQAIDVKLDELNVALDAMENKRDQIHEQLLELLKSSREIRKELQGEECADNTESK